ncbi:hypothetical protein [Sphaerochaeta halotolerans]|jgi:hypothetical protein|uniref:hypothetical protein n=1 Tax=Sphaerochaeta halotolerans TaxID=2293840 RepID=UPI0013697F4D|nr:hypothetical protein [Sphaerochaeta halotolerans]MXI86918.1 hypothetical protein [Sphaerochaeta halotolerans]
MSITTSLVDFSIDCTTSKANSFSYPITAIPDYYSVHVYEVINGIVCIPHHLVEKSYQPLDYYQDFPYCEKIVLNDEDFAVITNHIESVEPVENPNLKKLFTRYST